MSPVNTNEPTVLQSTLFVTVVNLTGFVFAQFPNPVVHFLATATYGLSLGILVSAYWRVRVAREKSEVSS